MAAADGPGLVVERALEAGRELQRTQHAQAVVGERARIDDAQPAGRQVVAAVEGIQVLAGERIPGDGVDGEVAAPGGLLERHRVVAFDRGTRCGRGRPSTRGGAGRRRSARA